MVSYLLSFTNELFQCLDSGLEEVHLFLYDTAGQERFADMAASYYRVGEVCLLCFDMSDLSTFDRTQFWKKKVSAALLS